MAEAIISGALRHGVLKKEQVLLKGHTKERVQYMVEAYGISELANLDAVATDVDVVVLAVKPYIIPTVLAELGSLPPSTVVVSIAAGVTLAVLAEGLPPGTPVIRVMPNTPVSVGEGMSAVSVNALATEDMIQQVRSVFNAIGKTVVGTEAMLDAIGAVAGCGPGYAFVIIDALADAGVRIGLTRKIAIEAAAQMLYGAAKMVLETGTHPAVLRDQVTSPGGTTVAGIAAMEKGGLRSALMDGVVAAMDRTLEMGKRK